MDEEKSGSQQGRDLIVRRLRASKASGILHHAHRTSDIVLPDKDSHLTSQSTRYVCRVTQKMQDYACQTCKMV